MSKKTRPVGVLWNVNEQRPESYHEDEDAAKTAQERFYAKSGDNIDLTDLDTAEFSVRLPVPSEPDKDTKVAKKDSDTKTTTSKQEEK